MQHTFMSSDSSLIERRGREREEEEKASHILCRYCDCSLRWSRSRDREGRKKRGEGRKERRMNVNRRNGDII